MSGRGAWLAPVAALALAFAAAPADAQKSRDTMRIAFLDPIQAVDDYTDPKPETGFIVDAVYDTLIVFDDRARRFAPSLAKEWRRVDARTLEFTLREDVSWHDGKPFRAEDVVHTIAWLIHPDTNLRFKSNWDWMESVEQTGPHGVRITAKRPVPFDLVRLAFNTQIYPEHIHARLENKSEFGRNPVGTGPYRVERVDPNFGVLLVRNPDYKRASEARRVSNIGRVHIVPLPDQGTQMASLLGGEIDVMRQVPIDQAEHLAHDPRFELTVAGSLSIIHMSFDALGRSGKAALKDQRVRRALMMAVNRDEVTAVRAGGRPIDRPESLCRRLQAGCDYSAKLPPFDPDEARRLLAEAGHARGLAVELTTFQSTRDYAEIVAGQLRRVGVEASVAPMTFIAYRQKQAGRGLQLLVSGWSMGAVPDVSGTLDFYFQPGPRDYYGDATIHRLREQALGEMDDDKRRAIVRQIMDRAVEQNYVIPLAPIAVPFVHTADLVMATGQLDPYAARLGDMNWK